MRSCLILGCGRSGTSMVAGCLASCGYFMGAHLHRPTSGNPKGYFEAPAVNRINDAIIRSVVPTRPPIIGRWTHPRRLGRTHMWLARLPVDTPELRCSVRLRSRMAALTQRRPFALKDPRFCYTLPHWRSIAEDAALVCVFRHPMATARSMLKETSRSRYAGLRLDESIALGVYACMYEHILTKHRHDGDWLFLHFDQVLQGDGLERLSATLDVKVDASFPDERLKRSTEADCSDARAMAAYTTLCTLADVSP